MINVTEIQCDTSTAWKIWPSQFIIYEIMKVLKAQEHLSSIFILLLPSLPLFCTSIHHTTSYLGPTCFCSPGLIYNIELFPGKFLYNMPICLLIYQVQSRLWLIIVRNTFTVYKLKQPGWYEMPCWFAVHLNWLYLFWSQSIIGLIEGKVMQGCKSSVCSIWNLNVSSSQYLPSM